MVTLGFGDLPADVTAGEQATSVVTLADDMMTTLTVSFGEAEYEATGELGRRHSDGKPERGGRP